MADKKFREEILRPTRKMRNEVLFSFAQVWSEVLFYLVCGCGAKTSNWPQPGILGRPPKPRNIIISAEIYILGEKTAILSKKDKQ